VCQECESITLEVETMVMLAEAERLVIDAEIAAGDSAAEAVRPLFPHEVAAKVRFSEIADLTNAAVAEAGVVLAGLRDVIVGAVMGEMLGDADEVTPTAAARALAQLNAAQPLQVQTAVARTTAALQGILGRVANGAAGIVQGEAARQGVKTGDWTPPAIDPEQFKLPAATAALHPWQRITGKLQATIIDPSKVYAASISRDDVAKELDNIPLDGSTDLAKQTIHSAQGIGRVAAAAELNPSEIFATEILDGNTCRPCAAMDGKEYKTMAEAKDDYPHGGFVRCLGGTRCRGTLVFMYDEPDPITDDPNPEPLPPIKPEPTPAPAPAEPAVPKKKRAPRKPKPAPVPDPEPVVPTPPPAPAPEVVTPAPKVAPVKPPAPKVAPAAPAVPATRKEALAAEKQDTTPGLPPKPTGIPPKIKKGDTQRYTALDQLPIQETAPGPKKKGALMVLASGLNPGYAQRTKQYMNNCSSVVQAYEMRRRGYDVLAAAVDTGRGRWDGEYVTGWWREKNGDVVTMDNVLQLPPPKDVRPSKTLVGGAIGPDGKKMDRHTYAKWRMDQEIESFPDGARGFTALQWEAGGGHVFSWEKVDGKAVYLEGQNGEPDSAAAHFTPGHFKPGSLRMVRIDDKVPTDLVTQALETRPTGVEVVPQLTSAEKNAKSKWRMRTGPKGVEYLPPEYRKNKSNRWELIPENERAQMLEEFLKKGRRNP
jgi:hypothetical protein